MKGLAAVGPELVRVIPDEPHTSDSGVHKTLRHRAVDLLIADGAVMDRHVENALREVPRHPFAPRFSVCNASGVYAKYAQDGVGREGDDARAAALEKLYSPSARPVISFANDGSAMVTMDTMRDVARLLELAQVAQGRKVLEIGTGTAYATTLLAMLTGSAKLVTSLETDGFAVRAAAQRFPEDNRPRLLREDGRTGDNAATPFSVVLSWCDVRRVPPAWVRQCSPFGRVVTTVAGQPVSLVRSEDPATQCELSGRFSPGDGVLSASPLRPHEKIPGVSVLSVVPQLAELTQLAEKGGTRVSANVPMGRLEHPTMRWLLELVHPDLRFEVLDTHYRVLDPYTRSWVNAYPGLGSAAYVEKGGTRRELWNEVMQVFTVWTRANRPERSEFGLTVTEAGEHTLWLGERSNVLMPLKPARQ